MIKNRRYEAVMPDTRNDFIDCITNKSEAIVLKNSLLMELDKELKLNQNKGKAKTALKTAGTVGLLVLNLYNPLTWIFGIGSLLAGGLLKNDLKEYSVHTGLDVNDKEILILVHKKKVNEKYDSIIYDKNYVKVVLDSKKSTAIIESNLGNKYKCEVYVRTYAEGGRHTPFFNNYRPRFRFGNCEITGVITLPDGTEMCNPGETVYATVVFEKQIQLSDGDAFVIVEGGKRDEKIVGTGTVIGIVE